MSKPCPCRVKEHLSLQDYSECCQPFHMGARSPQTPEQLMRSRYSAYYLGLGQYIYDTHHADFRGSTSVEEFTVSARNTHWCGLEVIGSSESGSKGTVEFKASFIDKDKLHTLHEISNFVLEDDRWLYTDGQFCPKQVVKISRNDPCPCGSGNKAKKCCLN